MAKKKRDELKPIVKKNKKVLHLFLLMIPSLLLAMTASIDSVYVRWFFQAVTLLMQFVLVKSMLDSFEGED